MRDGDVRSLDEIADQRHRRLLRARSERPCRRASNTDMNSRRLMGFPDAEDYTLPHR
jgi:hypothetical protein